MTKKLRLRGAHIEPAPAWSGTLDQADLSKFASEEDTLALPRQSGVVAPVFEDAHGAAFVMLQTDSGPRTLVYAAAPSQATSQQTKSPQSSRSRAMDLIIAAAQAVIGRGPGSGSPKGPPPPPIYGTGDIRNPSPWARDPNVPAPNRGSWEPSQSPLSSALSTIASLSVSSRITDAIAGSVFGELDADASSGEVLTAKFGTEAIGAVQQEALVQAAKLANDSGGPGLAARIAEFFEGGSSSATLGALREGDSDSLGNPIATGEPTVLTDGEPTARAGDPVAGPGVAVDAGVANVLIRGKPIARKGLSASAVGSFEQGSSSVFVGDAPPPPPPPPGGSDAEDNAKNSEEYANLPDVPAWMHEIFVDPESGNWMLFGGLIDLGSPEKPGAGTAATWWVPDRILGWDMSDYFIYHDDHFFADDSWSLSDLDKILGVEIDSFQKGIKPDLIQIALQTIYSTATTGVALGTAAMNSWDEWFGDGKVGGSP